MFVSTNNNKHVRHKSIDIRPGTTKSDMLFMIGMTLGGKISDDKTASFKCFRNVRITPAAPDLAGQEAKSDPGVEKRKSGRA